MSYNPKEYFDNGATVLWGHDLGDQRMQRLRSGEIFTLLRDGEPYRRLIMDSYDQLRESAVDNDNTITEWLGIPTSPFS